MTPKETEKLATLTGKELKKFLSQLVEEAKIKLAEILQKKSNEEKEKYLFEKGWKLFPNSWMTVYKPPGKEAFTLCYSLEDAYETQLNWDENKK